MVDNNQNEIETIETMEKIIDSPHNQSRVTVVYEYNPVTDLLGKGGYGVVYKALKKSAISNKNYAVKVFDKNNLYKDSEKSTRVLNEIKILRSLSHENICKYEHSFEDEKNVYIVMEFCEKGTLASFLTTRKHLQEIEIRYYMFQVLLVLQYLRRKKIVHRDLTLGNIFLKDYKTIKLGDFGLAFNINEDDEKSGLIYGTPGYYAPESNDCKYSYKTDIFDFGVCIYYLFGGKLPLESAQLSYDLFTNGKISFEKKIKLSEEALDLLKKTITVESKRLDINEIFEHPFFNKGKGLSKKNFPDYNDKDYMKKIDQLTQDFHIKAVVRETNKDISERWNRKRRGTKKKITSESSSSSSPSASSSSSEDSNDDDSSSSSYQTIKNNNNRRITFCVSMGKNKIFMKNDGYKERKSLLKNYNKSKDNLENGDNTEDNNDNDKIDFTDITLGGPKFENNVNDIDDNIYNSKIYYNYNNYNDYKTRKKLSGDKIIYITHICDDFKDYFGIGYKLNNKNIGILFNDDSQMTKINNNLDFIFYHKKEIISNAFRHTLIDLPPKNISNEMKGKIKFLYKIIAEFNKRSKKKKKISNYNKNINIEDDIYVIKYMKTDKGFLFIF